MTENLLLKFSSTLTWHHLHPQEETVQWARRVWFSGRIPKHSFISWVAARHRFSTRDILRNWGTNISPLCLLCNRMEETHQHLFFQCSFSPKIWTAFTLHAGLSPPSNFDLILLWLDNPSTCRNTTLIIRLATQATLYAIWKERNSKLHSTESRTAVLRHLSNDQSQTRPTHTSSAIIIKFRILPRHMFPNLRPRNSTNPIALTSYKFPHLLCNLS